MIENINNRMIEILYIVARLPRHYRTNEPYAESILRRFEDDFAGSPNGLLALKIMLGLYQQNPGFEPPEVSTARAYSEAVEQAIMNQRQAAFAY